MNTEKLEDEFVKLIEADTDAALQLITGMFVGLTLEYMRRRGHEPNGDIKIEGGHRRDITIHAAKPLAAVATHEPPEPERDNVSVGGAERAGASNSRHPADGDPYATAHIPGRAWMR